MKKNSYLCSNLHLFDKMGEGAKKILFVNSEIFPFLPESHQAHIGRMLPQGIQERKKEIRSFMPRFGCINERKNQLHEVIRLSGMNMIIGDVDRPLIIKVASVSPARMQVYFIDNEDYFRRKQLYCDESGKFFADNDERAIFFARGVLETVKKLRWAPDIIHCQGWISHLLPVYLKKVYNEDPIFASSKVVISFYDDATSGIFSQTFQSKALLGNLTSDDISFLAQPDGINLAKTAALYSDAVIYGSNDVDPELVKFCRKKKLPILPYNEESITNGSFIDEYNSIYDQL